VNKNVLENKIRKLLFSKPEISFAYIFGSFVQTDHYHDIDLAVYLAENFNKNDMKIFPYGYESLLVSEINLLVRKEIDLVVMNNAEITIQQRIINKGILLFSKDELKRVLYENNIRKLYIDAEPLRRIKRYYFTGKNTNA
jgi:predicted nucleotidyltransferase